MQHGQNHELVVNAQNNTVIKSKDRPLETAHITWDKLEGFCLKYGIMPEEAIARFLGVDPSTFDEDKSVVLMREQAKMSIDILKNKPGNEDKSKPRVTMIFEGL